MSTIKAYSDLPQSKKLAEILPIKSADMRYHTISHYNSYPCDEIVYMVEFGKASDKDIPCWSLAALLMVLPEPELIQNSEGKWTLIYWDKSRFPWDIGNHVNPVDACVEMIMKLHELKLL